LIREKREEEEDRRGKGKTREKKREENIKSEKQCCGSGSRWIRFQLARLDPGPYSESGSGSCK